MFVTGFGFLVSYVITRDGQLRDAGPILLLGGGALVIVFFPGLDEQGVLFLFISSNFFFKFF